MIIFVKAINEWWKRFNYFKTLILLITIYQQEKLYFILTTLCHCEYWSKTLCYGLCISVSEYLKLKSQVAGRYSVTTLTLTYLKHDYIKVVKKVLIICAWSINNNYAIFSMIIIDSKLYQHWGPWHALLK